MARVWLTDKQQGFLAATVIQEAGDQLTVKLEDETVLFYSNL
jgi:hypothetical protein